MKPVRSALLFVISVVLLSACFNPPEFSNSPSIAFKGISFQKAPNGEDSLVVSVTFQDGDGDLGFPAGPDAIIPPFHQINFFANDNGELLALPSTLVESFQGYSYKKTKKTPRDLSYYINELEETTTGELITLASRDEGFSLPPFERPYDCFINKEAYLNEQLAPDTIFIWRENAFLIKNKGTIVDTLVHNSNPNEWYFVVVNHFYIQENPKHYNFIVEFFVEENGDFVEYDFRAQFCETYDGRFPVLTDNERALEGEINYSMVGTGFLATFSIKRLKLRISVYDRAGNQSNVIETPPFRLEEI